MRGIRGQWQTDEQLADIGRVVVESANLENIIDQIIASYSGTTPEACAILMSTQMLGGKIECLSRLVPPKLRTKQAKKDFGDLIKRIVKLNSRRTIAVHGQWKPRNGGPGIQFIGFMPPLQPSDAATKRKPNDTLTAEEVHELGTEIQRAHQDLWRFWVNQRQ